MIKQKAKVDIGQNIIDKPMCDCLDGVGDEGIQFLRTIGDERHEHYCSIVRWEIKQGFRDKKTLKLVRFWCKYRKFDMDISACHILCCEADINRCDVLNKVRGVS